MRKYIIYSKETYSNFFLNIDIIVKALLCFAGKGLNYSKRLFKFVQSVLVCKTLTSLLMSVSNISGREHFIHMVGRTCVEVWQIIEK